MDLITSLDDYSRKLLYAELVEKETRRKHYLVTDDVDPQWKRILRDCHIEPRYALSPQAKGKVERPYGWLQDGLVGNCARENIKTITEARQVLRPEVDRYNIAKSTASLERALPCGSKEPKRKRSPSFESSWFLHYSSPPKMFFA